MSAVLAKTLRTQTNWFCSKYGTTPWKRVAQQPQKPYRAFYDALDVVGDLLTTPGKPLGAALRQAAGNFFADKSPSRADRFLRAARPMPNHHPCCAVCILLPVPWCSRATGRTSTAAVAGQPVLWDSLEIPDRVAKLAP